MIPLNIEDPIILRRTIEELEARLPQINYPITPITPIVHTGTATLVSLGTKLNEIIKVVNAISTALNSD